MKKLDISIRKILFVLAVWAILTFVKKNILPIKSAQSAVLQLQDSDTAYAQFKGVQSLVQYFWLLYILPLAVYIPTIKKLIKGDK